MTLEELNTLEPSEIEVVNHIQEQIDTLGNGGYELDNAEEENYIPIAEHYDLDDATDISLDDVYDLDMSRTKLPPKINMKVVAVIDPETKRKAWKYVRVGGTARMTSAEKIALKKAQRKAHSADAERKRKYTLKLKKMLGI